MQNDSTQWDEFRRISLVYVVVWIMAGLSFFLTALVGLYTHHHRGMLEVMGVFLALWIVPLWRTARRYVAWPCPNCGKPFVGSKGLRHFMPVACWNCGQKAFPAFD